MVGNDHAFFFSAIRSPQRSTAVKLTHGRTHGVAHKAAQTLPKNN